MKDAFKDAFILAALLLLTALSLVALGLVLRAIRLALIGGDVG